MAKEVGNRSVQKIKVQDLPRKKTIPYRFSEKHIAYIRRCQFNTINVLEGAVRSGKTVDNIFAFAHELKTTPDRIHLATGSTMGNAKLNIGDCDGFGLEWIFRGQCRWTRYLNLDALVIQGPLTNFKQKVVIFSGAGNQYSYQKIRGNSYGMWIATEINLHHDNTIKEAFNRQLAAKNRKIFWDLNPSAPLAPIYTNYIDRYKELSEQGKLLGGYNYEHMTIFDNINISKERIAEIVSQYEPGSVWYLRDIQGMRVLAEGLVYPMYIEAIAEPPEGTPDRYCLSIDYGTQNAFSAGLWAEYGDTWWRTREYYYSGRDSNAQKTDEDYAVDIDDFTEGIGSPDLKLRTIIDPSAASFIAVLRKRGKYRVLPADNLVSDGLRETATAMRTGKIKISPKCKNWIKEVQSYSWDAKATDDRPIKENDHAMDETRYFVKTMRIAKPQRKEDGGEQHDDYLSRFARSR